MDKVRIGIVGTGQRVCFHGGAVFKECSDRVRIAALCDIRPDRVMRAQQRYQEEFGTDIKTYTDYNEMYEKEKLDGVYIAGPNHLHRDMTVSAFEHGFHVLCEKPMELTLAKCDEMMEAARASGRILGLGMQMHYRKRYHKVKEIIAGGAIGTPVMAWCTEYRGPFIDMKDWVWEKSKSGGAIVEKNCHHYDIIDLWLGSEPTTVFASGSIAKHTFMSGKTSEIVDNAWIVNDYANGSRAMVGICFLAAAEHKREFGVQGTEGRIFFDLTDSETIHVETNTGERADYMIDSHLRGGIFPDFVDCVRSGRQPLVTGAMGRKSLLVPLAAEKSMEEKRVVHVSELK